VDRRKGKVGRVKSFLKKDLGGGETEDDISRLSDQDLCVWPGRSEMVPLLAARRESISI